MFTEQYHRPVGGVGVWFCNDNISHFLKRNHSAFIDRATSTSRVALFYTDWLEIRVFFSALIVIVIVVAYMDLFGIFFTPYPSNYD